MSSPLLVAGRTWFDRHTLELGQLEARKQALDMRLAALKEETTALAKAQEIVTWVAMHTQESVTTFLGEVVTLALNTVFGEGMSFKASYEIRRGKPELDFVILSYGQEFDPRLEVGGGVLDVVSFALRICLWVLAHPPTRNTLILDEPMRFVSKDKTERVCEMLEKVSKLLGLQIIMVSHDPALIDLAEVAYEVRQADGVSHVERRAQW